MTGSWRIEINGIKQDQYGRYGHIEGIELADIIWHLYGVLKTGDIITIICELAE